MGHLCQPVFYMPDCGHICVLVSFSANPCIIGPSLLAVIFAFLFSMMTSSNGNIFRVTGPLCGEFTGPGEFPTQRLVTRSFDVFFDLRPNKRLSKQPWGWWFETLSWPLWRHCNAINSRGVSSMEMGLQISNVQNYAKIYIIFEVATLGLGTIKV